MRRSIRILIALAAIAVVTTGCGGDGDGGTTTTTAASPVEATTTESPATTATIAEATSTTAATTTTEAPVELAVTVTGDELLEPVSVAWYPAFGSSFLYAEFAMTGATARELIQISATAFDADGESLGSTSSTHMPYVLRPGGTVLFMGTYFDGEINPAAVTFSVEAPSEYSASEFYRAGDGLVVSDVVAYEEGGNWYVRGVVANEGEYIEHVGVIAAVYDADGNIAGAELGDEYSIPELTVLETGASVEFVIPVYPTTEVVTAAAVADGFYSEYSDS